MPDHEALLALEPEELAGFVWNILILFPQRIGDN